MVDAASTTKRAKPEGTDGPCHGKWWWWWGWARRDDSTTAIRRQHGGAARSTVPRDTRFTRTCVPKSHVCWPRRWWRGDGPKDGRNEYE